MPSDVSSESYPDNTDLAYQPETAQFRLLKDWYLATLREQASRSQVDLTPRAMIDADKKRLEDLIVNSSVLPSPVKPYHHPWLVPVCCLSMALCVLIAAWTFGSGVSSGSPIVGFGLPLIAVLIAAITFECNKIVGAATATSQLLGNHKAQALRSYTEIPALVSQILRQHAKQTHGETLIVDASNNLLCCINDQRHLVALNQGMARLLSQSPAQLLLTQFDHLLLPEEIPRFISAVQLTQNEMRPARAEVRMRTSRGLAVDVSLSIEWSKSSNLYFISGEDITSNRMLERARAEFISTMGHDIKIPLSSVYLGLQYLAEELKTANNDQKDLIERLDNNVKRLIELIDELLDYEKSQAKPLELAYSMVSLPELIYDSLDAVQAAAEAKRIKLEWTELNLVLRADASKLQRVIVNLLSNAIKFSPNNSEIEIRTTVEGQGLELHILDQGPGIPEGYRQIIFERYERLPSSISEDGKGLGLSICKTIIESHNGLLGTRERSGGGSDFWFNIPLQP